MGQRKVLIETHEKTGQRGVKAWNGYIQRSEVRMKDDDFSSVLHNLLKHTTCSHTLLLHCLSWWSQQQTDGPGKTSSFLFENYQLSKHKDTNLQTRGFQINCKQVKAFTTELQKHWKGYCQCKARVLDAVLLSRVLLCTV